MPPKRKKGFTNKTDESSDDDDFQPSPVQKKKVPQNRQPTSSLQSNQPAQRIQSTPVLQETSGRFHIPLQPRGPQIPFHSIHATEKSTDQPPRQQSEYLIALQRFHQYEAERLAGQGTSGINNNATTSSSALNISSHPNPSSTGLTSLLRDEAILSSNPPTASTATESASSRSTPFKSKKMEKQIEKSAAVAEARGKAPRKHGESRQKVCGDCNEIGHTGKSSKLCAKHDEHVPKKRRTKFIIKTSLSKVVTRLNASKNQRFKDYLQIVVKHCRDVSYVGSLFLNYHCLNIMKSNKPLPVLNQQYFYDTCSLIMGLGTKAPLELTEGYKEFQILIGPVIDWTLFKTRGVSSIITEVARSYEVLLRHHIGSNYKRRTEMYFMKVLSDKRTAYYISTSVATRRLIARIIYQSIVDESPVLFPNDLKITAEDKRRTIQLKIDSQVMMTKDLEENAKKDLGEDEKQKMAAGEEVVLFSPEKRKTLFKESEVTASPHLYIPWLHHILQNLESQASIKDSLPEKKASKGFVHRKVHEVMDTKKFSARFIKVIEYHVRERINSATINDDKKFINRSFSKHKYNKGKGHRSNQDKQYRDLTNEEKKALDQLVYDTREEIFSNTFRPEKYTDPRGARLFTLVPIFSMSMRHIPLNFTALKSILHNTKALDTKKKSMNDICWELFDMKEVGFDSFEQLAGSNVRKGFTGALRTDGFDIEFICDRPTPSFQSKLTPSQVAQKVNINDATIWGVDPGVREIFVASDGTAKESHRVRRTSTAEFYQLAGYNKDNISRAKFDAAHADYRAIIAATPSIKVSIIESYIAAVNYIFNNFKKMTDYYDMDMWKNKCRFLKYKNKQRAICEISKRLLNGSKKYSPTNQNSTNPGSKAKWRSKKPSDLEDERTKPIIIAYGAAEFGNLRGNVCAPAKLIKTAISRFVKERSKHAPTFMVTVDEYLTSQVCPICNQRTTEHAKDTGGQEIYPVLICTNCSTRWNRDHMASINIRNVFLHMASNSNQRPEPFKRKEKK